MTTDNVVIALARTLERRLQQRRILKRKERMLDDEIAALRKAIKHATTSAAVMHAGELAGAVLGLAGGLLQAGEALATQLTVPGAERGGQAGIDVNGHSLRCSGCGEELCDHCNGHLIAAGDACGGVDAVFCRCRVVHWVLLRKREG